METLARTGSELHVLRNWQECGRDATVPDTWTWNWARPPRKTAEIVPQGARAQFQVQVSGTVASRPHSCQLRRTWSSLPVRARVSMPPDIGTPCSTVVVYSTWPCLPQAD